MRWLDDIETKMLEYLATRSYQERLDSKPVDRGSAEDLAYDRLIQRGLASIAHREGGLLTLQITPLGKLIRDVLRMEINSRR